MKNRKRRLDSLEERAAAADRHAKAVRKGRQGPRVVKVNDGDEEAMRKLDKYVEREGIEVSWLRVVHIIGAVPTPVGSDNKVEFYGAAPSDALPPWGHFRIGRGPGCGCCRRPAAGGQGK